jgi:hypothetical protein
MVYFLPCTKIFLNETAYLMYLLCISVLLISRITNKDINKLPKAVLVILLSEVQSLEDYFLHKSNDTE